jgi:hypothetical protein
MPETEDVQGEGFQILGHEGQKTEEPPVEEQPAAEPEAGARAEETAAGPGELPKLDVYSVLHVSVAQLAAVAWQKMGLQADPLTNQVEKDIEQARVAIDAAAGLIEKLQPKLEKLQARDYQNLLTDLRLNFLRQSGEQS